jgi:dTDP-4-dehydrorhamnose 3,5-epimerase
MDQRSLIEGVILTSLMKIESPEGCVLRYLRDNDVGFNQFKESYFSTVNKDVIKPWKRHMKMSLNIAVPVGEIKFVLYDNRPTSSTYGSFNQIILSPENYLRLTVPADVWMAFKGQGNYNLLINTADLVHDPDEVERKNLSYFKYDF